MFLLGIKEAGLLFRGEQVCPYQCPPRRGLLDLHYNFFYYLVGGNQPHPQWQPQPEREQDLEREPADVAQPVPGEGDGMGVANNRDRHENEDSQREPQQVCEAVAACVNGIYTRNICMQLAAMKLYQCISLLLL